MANPTSWEKRLRSASTRTEADARRRDLIEASLADGLRFDDLNPDDIRSLDALLRVAQAEDAYESTIVLHTLSGRRIGEATVVALNPGAKVVISTDNYVSDAFTGLSGRVPILERAAFALNEANLHGSFVGLLWCDIDRFGAYNELAGHPAGDELLREVAALIGTGLRDSDTLGRMGADDFVIVAAGLAQPDDAIAMAQRITDAMKRSPLRATSGTSLSIGVAVGRRSDTAESLVWQAEQAMRLARRAGGDRFATYDDQARLDAARRRDVNRRLRQAFDDHTLDVDFQPIVDIAAGRLYGLEALLRLRLRQDDGPGNVEVNPRELIRVADDSGILLRVEGAVLGISCARLAHHLQADPALRLAVNISDRQLRSSDLAGVVDQILGATGVRATSIDLEVAEAGFFDDVDGAAAGVERLSKLGFRVVIDDFNGSPLNLARAAAVGVGGVKLNPRILLDHHDPRHLATLAGHAADLGLTLTAVGVESQDQLVQLRSVGCRLAQGFYLSPPLPPHRLHELGPIGALAYPTPT